MSESIYNLVPREQAEYERKQFRITSKASKPVVPYSTFGCHGSTRLLGAGQVAKKDGAYFGPPKPETGLPRTTSPARTSTEERQSNEPFSYTDRRKLAVPSKTDRPILGITTSKNFITANAVEAILQVPKRQPQPELNYMKKEDFGKIPAYLTQVKEEIRRENEMIERYVKHQMGEIERTPESFEELTQDERDYLLEALKSKWDYVNSQYQKFTHLVVLDTAGQIRRKEQFETELSQLETDIEKLQRASAVLIRK
mmetsp:Transcript_12272/g.8924  ORF Transcript_12272/g.8924 Transcript_12272/m.8924 type:complete len:255 (-) Transcript_12272:17-781(-)